MSQCEHKLTKQLGGTKFECAECGFEADRETFSLINSFNQEIQSLTKANEALREENETLKQSEAALTMKVQELEGQIMAADYYFDYLAKVKEDDM